MPFIRLGNLGVVTDHHASLPRVGVSPHRAQS